MRYMAFVFGEYYPQGGMIDFAGSYETLEEAKNVVDAHEYNDCGHVFDLDKQEIVYER